KRKHSRSALAIAFDGRGHDVWGIGFVGLGLVAALGIYFDKAGSLGRGLDDLAGWCVGLLRVFVPVVAVLAGYLLMRGHGEHQRDRESAGTVFGGALVVVVLAAFSHLFGGRPALSGGASALGDAGGVLGLAIGEPLRTIASIYGAVLVLFALGLIGGVIFTGIPMSSVLTSLGSVLAPVRDALSRGLQSLFQVDDAEAFDVDENYVDDDVEVAVPALFDGADAEDDEESDEDEDAEYEEYEEYEDEDEEGEYEEEDEEDDAATAPAPRRKRAGVITAGDVAWKLPPLSLLKRAQGREIDKVAVKERGRLLERALAEHGVQTRLVGMVVGPTVTRYELELGPGVKVARVTSLHRDIAYAMASPDVRILAPIPGRQAIGVEVPNEQREIVALGDILASAEARNATHPLEVAVGRDINGRSILMNLATMPHLLIAGATGAGKSSCINSLITSILMRSTPDQVRMILVDPKMVEMGQYDRIPHLLTAVVTDPKKAANALSWAVREMERRYELLSECGFRDLDGYNAAHDRGELQPGLGEVDDDGEPKQYQRLSYILVVVDELADLMMVAARDVEESICRIAQKARAVGIHLIIATQRPSVNVITGLIKANVQARLAFSVSSQTDSRVILDHAGAERLVGKGDMLLVTPASSTPHRIQGSWVSEEEVRGIVAAWRRQAPTVAYEQSVAVATIGSGEQLAIDLTDEVVADMASEDDGDELLIQAMELIVNSQLGSTSMLQRKLRVGFARAGRIMDLLEQRGVVGPSEGSKARAVLMTPDELEELKAARR
ncbi:MAG TPA: DNA translocase FtsK 4TM domain-containing protein, partial [Acidimicrobiales bacterium]|nr:DNA translocase FtsK 4TM domain-containing protein [Acidimicrobiales bacterium]